jgi:hypothetical protein
LVWVHSPGVYILDNILEEELSEGVGSSLDPPPLVFLFSLVVQIVYQVLHDGFRRPRTGSTLDPPLLVFLFSLVVQTVHQVMHDGSRRPRTRNFALLDLKLPLQLLHFELLRD